MSSVPRRVFLDWNGPTLPRAADWLAEAFGDDVSRVVVATPGARAARRLAEHLARRLSPAWHPPRILTAGVATDAFLTLPRPVADRPTRTLAWRAALAELPARTAEWLLAHRPAADDAGAWLALAAEVRALFGEVAAEGLDFHDVLTGPLDAASAGERARWTALAAAQDAMLGLLDAAGLDDPHRARLAALRAGEIDETAALVLVGVSDAPGLLRRLAEQLGDRVTSLVFAPESLAERFCPLGCVRPEAWADAHVSLDLERWHVVDQPIDQARTVESLLGRWSSRFAADEVTVGVADPDVVPGVHRRLAEHGVAVRDAAGTPWDRTLPATLLDAVGRWLGSRSYADYAALVRHPDLEDVLRRALEKARRDGERATPEGREERAHRGGAAPGASEPGSGSADPAPTGDAPGGPSRPPPSPAELLDPYHEAHLPARVDGTWRIDAGDPRRAERERERAARLETMHAALMRLLGPLAHPGMRPASEWVEPLRAFLDAVYGRRVLDPSVERDRLLAGSLDLVAGALGTLAALPPALAPPLTGRQALGLLTGSLLGSAVPPGAADEQVATVDLLGWLELPLDDAPALVVTGFSEGRVPAPQRGDRWLPDRVRAELGLVDESRRLARDLHALEVLLHAKEEVAVVTGRRTRDKDPLLPSRLAFHVSPDRVVEHVRHALLPEGSGVLPVAEPVAGTGWAPVLRRGAPPPEAWSPTSFRTWLASPYLFFLQRVERLDSLDDRQRELTGRAFGNLAHRVLEAWGRSDLADSDDETAIGDHLERALRDIVADLYGTLAKPAVALQSERLARRLRAFAAAQAARRREGWVVHAVEWSPDPDGVPFDVDRQPILLRGVIDRIDHHPEHGWAILDYKTGETVKDPEKSHRTKDGAWIDLQLPLYAWMARELVGDAPVALGYVVVSSRDEVEFSMAPWTAADVESALHVARDVVRAVRAGMVTARGDPPVFDLPFRWLCGQGLVGTAAAEPRWVDVPVRSEVGDGAGVAGAASDDGERDTPATGWLSGGDAP